MVRPLFVGKLTANPTNVRHRKRWRRNSEFHLRARRFDQRRSQRIAECQLRLFGARDHDDIGALAKEGPPELCATPSRALCGTLSGYLLTITALDGHIPSQDDEFVINGRPFSGHWFRLSDGVLYEATCDLFGHERESDYDLDA